MEPGVTLFALHATTPGEIETIAPDHAGWRTREYALFASGAVAEWCAAAGVVPIGYRDIQKLWREASANKLRAVSQDCTSEKAGVHGSAFRMRLDGSRRIREKRRLSAAFAGP